MLQESETRPSREADSTGKQTVPTEIDCPLDEELRRLVENSARETNLVRLGAHDDHHYRGGRDKLALIKLETLKSLLKKGRVSFHEIHQRFPAHREEILMVFRIVSNLVHHGRDTNPRDIHRPRR